MTMGSVSNFGDTACVRILYHQNQRCYKHANLLSHFSACTRMGTSIWQIIFFEIYENFATLDISGASSPFNFKNGNQLDLKFFPYFFEHYLLVLFGGPLTEHPVQNINKKFYTSKKIYKQKMRYKIFGENSILGK